MAMNSEVLGTVIRIPNTRLLEVKKSGEDIDKWLINAFGYGGKRYHERFSFSPRPYRAFWFKEEADEVMFLLTWS